MKKPITIVLLVLTFLCHAQTSQIKIIPQSEYTEPDERIVGKLISHGVEIKEIRTNFSRETNAMGVFLDKSRYFGMTEGMVLSTGTVTQIVGENSSNSFTSVALTDDESKEIFKDVVIDSINGDVVFQMKDSVAASSFIKKIIKPGDDDLSKEIEGLQTFDARVVEIKFVPSAEMLYYRYVFASEEYDEFVCSKFNDIFAFYLYEADSDDEHKNIAIIPNTNLPVSINTVNNGNPGNPECEEQNSHLYQKNNGEQNLIFDGFTKVLDVRHAVKPGKEYIIKIAIADASDHVLDSAVLIENNSIFSYYDYFEINFDYNSALPNQFHLMLKTLNALKEHPGSKVQLIGHADKVGSDRYNFNLSILRVEAIKEYLIGKGITEDRIIEIYKGETMPRYSEDSKNRRVEVFVLGE